MERNCFFQHSINAYTEYPLVTVMKVSQLFRLKLDATQTTPSSQYHSHTSQSSNSLQSQRTNNKSTFPAKAEAALTNAMETTTTSNDNT